jgi:hypothetical protein
MQDFLVPPGMPPPAVDPRSVAGVAYSAARWQPADLAALATALTAGAPALDEIPDDALLEAWLATVDAFLDPDSGESRQFRGPLAALCTLSEPALAAALAAVLGGVRRPAAAAILARAAAAILARAAAMRSRPPATLSRQDVTPAPSPAGDLGEAGDLGAARSPVLVVLASNLPALAVQPLLPALALRRPVLLKSPSAEPLFAPAFLAALVRREPRLARGVAAATWAGGDAALEAPILAAAGTVLAYGGADALHDLSRRAAGTVVGYGPKTSLAAVDPAGCDLAAVAAGLARDVALFDQRGCLSVAAVYVQGDLEVAVSLGRHLEIALAELATLWPPGPTSPASQADLAALAAVQQARLSAELQGLRGPAGLDGAWSLPTVTRSEVGHPTVTRSDPGHPMVARTEGCSATAPRIDGREPASPLAAGTVLIEPDPAFRPSPGLRTVRIHPLADLDRLPEILAPWRDHLQGAALAGAAAWSLAPRLAALGISRFAAPGDLQSPDASWHNGGIDPLAALAGPILPAG